MDEFASLARTGFLRASIRYAESPTGLMISILTMVLYLLEHELQAVYKGNAPSQFLTITCLL